jgi:hypothetical protein
LRERASRGKRDRGEREEGRDVEAGGVHGPFRIPGGSGDVEDGFCVGLGLSLRLLKEGATADFANNADEMPMQFPGTRIAITLADEFASAD